MSPLISHKVPLIEKFAFGMRAFSQQLGNNGMTLFAFPAYGIILGLDPALIGLVFALMRIYDAIIDPLMGWVSDNTRTRWGRRRPYIFIGAILGGIAFALLWLASPDWSDTAKAAYFITFSIFFYTAFTIMVIPADALGWELTPDYSERTRVMAWFSAIVKITGMIMPWMFALTQSPIWQSESQGLRAVGVLFGLGFALTGILPAIFCKERNFKVASSEGKVKLGKSLWLCLKNRSYRIVCGFTLFSIFGGTVYMLFGTHIAVYYLFEGSRSQGGQFFGILGTIAALVGLAAVLVVNKFFSNCDKRTVMIVSISTAVAGWLSAIVLMTPINPWLTLVPVCLNAIAVSSFWLLLGSVLADVADEDELHNGYRREGSLASFISFLCKLAGTLAGLLGGIALSVTGFDAALDQQPGQTLQAMRFVYVGFPIIGYSLALYFALKYPLKKERMLAIRAELEARRGSVV